MTAFQLIVLAILAVLCLLTVSASARGHVRKRVAALWLLVWISGGVALVWPRSTILVAQALGVGRGADLLLYLSALVMLIGFFYVYTRFRRLDRQITLLVRRLAIESANAPAQEAERTLPRNDSL